MSAHTVPVTTPRRRARAAIGATVMDAAAYWLVAAGIYLSYGFLWYYAAKEKLFDQDGQMPAGLQKAFEGRFLDTFPGLNAAWVLLGILEAVCFLVIVASLVTGEFLPRRGKPILFAGLALSLATFAVMSVAQDMVGNFDSVASLFAYMGVTAVLMAVVRFMPARGGRHWTAPADES